MHLDDSKELRLALRRRLAPAERKVLRLALRAGWKEWKKRFLDVEGACDCCGCGRLGICNGCMRGIAGPELCQKAARRMGLLW